MLMNLVLFYERILFENEGFEFSLVFIFQQFNYRLEMLLQFLHFLYS